jgi:hypothetical protein
VAFLGNLADQLNNTFSPGENSSDTLDAVVSGQNLQYATLGDISSQLDHSIERRYLEDGFLRADPYHADPKAMQLLLQQPSATILLKKSMFSSVNENYRPDFMDQDEKLYFKAMKTLFQNKCRQIAVLEKLSKIQQVTAAVGNISDQLLPLIISLSDQLSSPDSGAGGANLFGSINSNGEVSSFTKVIERIRRLYAFNHGTNYTNWIIDPTLLFQSQLGQGTGVIEITNFTALNTTVTNDLKNPGNFGFNLVDPYGASVISEWDIEKAISDASNAYYNHKIFQFGQQAADQVVNNFRTTLSQLRAARGASDINFIIGPSTAVNQPVTAIISSTGVQIQFTYNAGSVSVPSAYIQGGVIAGFQGLSISSSTAGIGPDSNIVSLTSQSELAVFQQLISAIYQQIQLNNNSQSQFQASNQYTNYTRRKLRFHFGGKLIIQPMDIVHIYINSRSRYDNHLLTGMQNMFSGLGILQNPNNTTNDLFNATSILFNPSSGISLQAEKAAFVGPEFPTYLWSLLRNQFVVEKDGTHVFAGIVESAPEDWREGKYSIDVKGSDNTYYFKLGKLNWKPGVDTFNGPLFDPLTPFKTTFDTITSESKSNTLELLDENKYLLGGSTDGTQPLVKYKLGPNAGLAARTDNIIQDKNIDKVTGSPSKTFYAPDGLVYKWKEGIGTLVQFGSSIDVNDPSKIGNPALTKEPFAGQDVMNVISLLITGQPYNFANYWRAVSNIDGFNNDPQTGQNAAYSYYSALKTDLVKNNITWGNFIPFKSLKMDEASFAKTLQNQLVATQRNQQLDTILQQLANVQNRLNILGQAATLDPSMSSQFASPVTTAESLSSNLANQANSLIAQIQAQNQGLSNAVGPSGDATYDTGNFNTGNSASQGLSDASQRRSLRQQVNYLTRRMSYNVRGNDDKNFFIVDDTYDKDYDILAYEQSLADGIPLYNNEFNSVKDKIVTTADLLNLEVFADTQGHIRARAPLYNNMPSSVFYRMMNLKKTMGIQIFPQFLEDIFDNQINTLTNRVEVLENQIRLNCAVLGFNTDTACVSFLVSGASNNVGATSNTAETFSFISNESTFRITSMASVLSAANPDTTNLVVSISSQAQSNNQVFTNTQRAQFTIQALTTGTLNQSGASIFNITPMASNPRINALIQILKTDTGQQISTDNYVLSTSLTGNAVSIPAGQSIDVFKVTLQLQQNVTDRQKALKLLYNAIKNSTEAKSLDNNQTASTTNQAITPGIYGNQNVPEVFEHMIEDETYDDYGPGSGTRYIIKNAQIKSYSLAENAPDFTYIQVNGQLSPFLPSTLLPGALNSFPQQGNGLVSAAAIDYDLWRKYGLIQQNPINVPFLQDPNNQCAPYASMILSRARKNIIRGSVTIAGNEYMQPGEVIYLEDRQLLFYVTAVRHSYSSGSNFSTTLDLAYGHSPGDYIPTTLDVIGKLIYSNRDLATTTVQRQSSTYNDTNMGVVVYSPQVQSGANVISSGSSGSSATNAYTATNGATINNILYQAAYIINANQSNGNTISANVELRIYYDDNNSVNSDLQSFANQVQTMLTTSSLGNVQTYNSTSMSANLNPPLPSSNVSIITVNMSDPNQTASPSQKAFDMARNLMGQNSTSGSAVTSGQPISTASVPANPTSYQDQLRISLFQYVVDCWLTFTQVPTNMAQSNGSASATQSGGN